MKYIIILLLFTFTSFANVPNIFSAGDKVTVEKINENFNNNEIYSCTLVKQSGSHSGTFTYINTENDCDEWLNNFDDDVETFSNGNILLSVKPNIFKKRPLCWSQLLKLPAGDGGRDLWFDPASTKDNLSFIACYAGDGGCQRYFDNYIIFCKN